jgi:PAS domain S-box-containing protein
MVDAGKPEAQFIEEVKTARQESSLAIYFGLLPVLSLFVLVIGLWQFPPPIVVFEPRYLLPLFNSSLFLAAGVIAFIAWRSYLLSGLPTILWLGCGVLTLGAGALAAGWLIYPFGPNTNVTIFNVAVLLAAICHAGGVLSTLEEKPRLSDPGQRQRKVALGYLAVLTAIALLVALTLAAIMPPFFIQWKGPTVLRQYVVEWALVLLTFASLVIMQRFLRKRAPFLYWYSLALALVAISMLAFFLQPAVGSLIGWAGRSSYVLAAVYFLLSANSALREARTRGLGLSEAFAELFGPGLHWQGIMATVSDAVVSYNEKGQILLWNKAAERIFGYPEGEAVGKGIDLILPDTQSKAPGNDGEIKEIEPARQDGSRFNAEISVSSKGSALGVITTLVIRDVTERRRAEEALRESETKYRNLFEYMTEEVHFWQLVRDADGCIKTWWLVDANPPTLKTWGRFTLDEIKGKTTDEIFGPGSTEHYMPVVQKIMTEGVPYSFEDYFPNLDKYFQFTSVPLGDYFITTGTDITDIKKAEEALRQSEAQLRTILDNLTEGVVVSTMDGQLSNWNRAALEMHGYAGLEESHHQLADVPETFELATLDGAVLPIEQWPLTRILRGEQVRNLELWVRRKD